MIDFEFPQDKEFFDELFIEFGGVEKFPELFDFSEPKTKRDAFSKIRAQIFAELKGQFGDICMLNSHKDCSQQAENVDHFIPLQSNVLNKKIRNLVRELPKKVPSQSFGSNHKLNLVLACSRCNGHKLNKFPSKEMLFRVLTQKYNFPCNRTDHP